jgi:hypothetical protein
MDGLEPVELPPGLEESVDYIPNASRSEEEPIYVAWIAVCAFNMVSRSDGHRTGRQGWHGARDLGLLMSQFLPGLRRWADDYDHFHLVSETGGFADATE